MEKMWSLNWTSQLEQEPRSHNCNTNIHYLVILENKKEKIPYGTFSFLSRIGDYRN